MNKQELDYILQYLKDNIPMTYDMESCDLMYDKKNINFRIYMCIRYLIDKIKKLEGK